MATDWVSKFRALDLSARHFIDGRPLGGDDSLQKDAPRDGTALYRFGHAGTPDIDAAVAAAKKAFEDGRWSGLPVQRRKDILFKLASLIETHREELALLESLDVGKPINDSLEFDIPASAATIRFNAEAADKVYGEVYSVDQSSLSYQLRRPVGVVCAIVGWNFPLLLAAAKISPALTAGNSVVLKPSELTPLSASRLAQLAAEAGVPDGVLNLLLGGAAVGGALGKHPDVDLLTFTGSTATGKHLLIAAGQSNMKRLILECGGKAPNIVFDDCPDLGAVADAVVSRAFWNQGQVCTASSRLLVHENIKEALLELIMQRADRLLPGDPLDPATRFGALVSRAHKNKVAAYAASAEGEGAQLRYRSAAPLPNQQGFYVAPLIYDCLPTQRLAQEEIFGPLLSVISFRDEEEAIRIANGTIYGLSVILWTKNVQRAHRMTYRIKAGWVVVNATSAPTGGPGIGVLSVGGHKQSGIGVEGGLQGLAEYSSQTAVQLFL